MGALLASALIIMPSATARQLTSKMSRFFPLAVGASVLSVAAGFLLNAFVLDFPRGTDDSDLSRCCSG